MALPLKSDRPILFSGPMVRALLEGRKTQTRRCPAWKDAGFGVQDYASEQLEDFDVRGWDQREQPGGGYRIFKPSPWQHVKEGDRLWVREAYSFGSYSEVRAHVRHKQGHKIAYSTEREQLRQSAYKWRPSIHMPRWASRLTLIVTADARVERLQDISEDDAIAEGALEATHLDYVGSMTCNQARDAWQALWQSLHTKPGERWEDNPELVVIAFRVVHGNIDEVAP